MKSLPLFTIYTTSWCGDCFRIKQFLQQQNLKPGEDYIETNIEENAAAAALVEQLNNGHRSVPTLVFTDGEVMTEPSTTELQTKLMALQVPLVK